MSPGLIERLNAALEGRYSVERKVGEGGRATVYVASDLRHERKVALKVLKPELAEVYRRSFPDGEGQIPVSVGGGTEPVWAPDQTAIYYRNGSQLMRVGVTQGGALAAGGPEQLLELPSWALDSNGGVHTSWDVHPEGGTFVLVVGEANDSGGVGFAVAPVRVVLNWFEELRQRVRGPE